jgi:hypothetical protein
MRFQLPWERSRARYGELIPPASAAAAKDEEMNDFDAGLDGIEEDSEREEDEAEGARRSVKPMIWMVLSVVATLEGRRMLRGGFGE